MDDFDFLTGSWHVANRWIAPAGGIGSDDWEEFAATAECRPFFGGAGNHDVFDCPAKGWRGMTLRLYQPERRQWSIWWASDRTGELGPPVTGRFVDGRGEFFGDDTHDGTPAGVPVRVRYRWTVPAPDAPRWEQAYSTDGGQTWETNWIMDLTRRGP
ncbi:MAG: hypothetical protein ACJ73S_06670 [Mycobacteriales bacterium]